MTVLAGHEVLFVPQQFATIQLAIDAVAGPATIVIGTGVYPESVSVIGKPYLVLQSARLSKRGVTVSGGNVDAPVLSVERAALFLSGIEIRSNARRRGITAIHASISLQKCVVIGNRVAEGLFGALGAGMFALNSNVRIQKSAFLGNTVDATAAPVAGGGGLYLQDCRTEIAGSTIQGNAVYSAGELRGGGIWSERSSMRLWRSRVTDNALCGDHCKGGGIYFKEPLNSQLGGSFITGNSCQGGRGGGIFVDGDATHIAVHRNTVVGQNHPTDRELA
jgi:hypothetical protein